ncbi:helix-turn-helix domain-containing protein [Streptomyces sp. x-80]|uniref:helix-turn-helix domain-containing protein n=1 Tax=Streptomyces sp. x-80 TaxID=2789282 RepID=UPI00397ED4D0
MRASFTSRAEQIRPWGQPRRRRCSRSLEKRLTVDEVAEILQVPRSWVYGNWRTERIPFRKIGQSLRCRPSDFEAWFDSRRV